MKKNIAVVSGGYSGEAQISYKSAATVLQHLDKEKYNLFDIRITKQSWLCIHLNEEYVVDRNDFSITIKEDKIIFDCVFNIIHGTPGEDGKFQGYLEMLGIPHTSCSVAVSAITFNKGMTTSLLSSYGINVAKSYILFSPTQIDEKAILDKVGLPCFVKPNNGGSSIGTFKVTNENQLKDAINNAFKEDGQVIVEEFIAGTEVTCSAIKKDGNAKAMAVTEIVAASDFFDFNAKYEDEKTQEITPARISDDHYKSCLELTERIYGILNCKGMVRIDYILKNDKWYLIEVNSIPGLTERSLTPQHAEYIKLSKSDLFGLVIEEALKN